FHRAAAIVAQQRVDGGIRRRAWRAHSAIRRSKSISANDPADRPDFLSRWLHGRQSEFHGYSLQDNERDVVLQRSAAVIPAAIQPRSAAAHELYVRPECGYVLDRSDAGRLQRSAAESAKHESRAGSLQL